jgi:hypothetical protein
MTLLQTDQFNRKDHITNTTSQNQASLADHGPNLESLSELRKQENNLNWRIKELYLNFSKCQDPTTYSNLRKTSKNG